MSNCCQRDSLGAWKRRQRERDTLCCTVHLLSHVLFANQPCQSLASFSSWKPLTLPLTLPRTQHWHNVNVPYGFKWVSTMHIGIVSLFARQNEESWPYDSLSWCFFCHPILLVPSLLDHHMCTMADQVSGGGAKVAFSPGFYACGEVFQILLDDPTSPVNSDSEWTPHYTNISKGMVTKGDNF